MIKNHVLFIPVMKEFPEMIYQTVGNPLFYDQITYNQPQCIYMKCVLH